MEKYENISGSPNLVSPWFFRSVWRLLIFLFIVLVIPFGILFLVMTSQINKTLEQQALEQNKVTARVASKVVEEYFDGLIYYVKSYSMRHKLTEMVAERESSENVSVHLRELVKENDHFERAFITDIEGNLLYDYPHDPSVLGQNFSHRDWFKGVNSSKQVYISEIYQRAALGQSLVVAIASPMYDEGGDLIGYLVAQNPIQNLINWLVDLEPYSNSLTMLIDMRGNFFRQTAPGTGELLNLEEIPEFTTLVKSPRGFERTTDPFSAEESLLNFTTVRNSQWTILISQPISSILAPVALLKLIVFFLLASCFALLLLAGFLWVNSIRQYNIKNLQMAEDIKRLNEELEANLYELENVNNVLESKVLERTSELAKINYDLKSKNLELISINEELDNFVYSASHDLKAPVINLQTLLQLIFSGEVDEKEKPDMIEKANRSIDKLINTITALSIAAKAQKEVYEDVSKIQFHELIQEVILEMEAIVDSKKVKISTDFSAAPEITYSKMGLKSILYNLLSNAIKYADEERRPEIEVSTRISGNYIELSVKDNGLGFDIETNKDKIFQLFKRAHDHVEGTGIGLYMIKKIVEKRGGHIEVESKPGIGSVFRVYFLV